MISNVRVAAYCRVSTEKDEQANSLESQRRYFKEYIDNRDDWILTEVYYDEGISGTQTLKRAGFNRMIEDAIRGKLDLIVTKEVSRFARNTVDTLLYTRKLKDYDVGVIFTIDNIDTREPDGELRLTIMASLAQEESRKTSERVKWGQKRQMERGVVFGRDLLGYTVKDGVLKINELEAPTVRTIFHKYTNEGKGTHIIARELIEEGMRPKRIALWNHTVILRVLKNEKYAGDLCQKKTITPDFLTHQKKYNRGEEELIYIKNHHVPIIDRELWDRTQRELKRRGVAEEQKSKHSSRYWCSGKLECGICGCKYVSRTKKRRDGTTYKAWRCYASANHGILKQNAAGEMIGCSNQSYNEHALLAVIRHCMQHVQMNRKQLKQEILNEIKGLSKILEYKNERTEIEREINFVKEKKRKVLDLLLSGMIKKEEAKEQNEWYDLQIEDLEKKLYSYNEAERIEKKQKDEMETYLQVLDEIIDGNLQEIPELFYKEIVDKIILFPENTLLVYFNCIPFEIEVKIRTFGKKESYCTEIVSIKVEEFMTEIFTF